MRSDQTLSKDQQKLNFHYAVGLSKMVTKLKDKAKTPEGYEQSTLTDVLELTAWHSEKQTFSNSVA